MVNTQIFVVADAIVAMMLALAFLGVRIFDRRLGGVLWWALAFASLSVLFSTIGTRAEDPHVIVEIIAWTLSFTFGAGILIGVAHSYEQDTPGRLLSAMLGLQASIIAGGVVLNAPIAYWETLGRLPAVLMILASIFVIARVNFKRLKNLSLAIALVVLAMVFMGRGLYFATAFGTSVVTEDPLFVMKALTIVILTLLGEVATALTLILSALLRNLAKARQKSAIDGLSQLYTRDEFEERAVILLAEAEARGVPVTLILADIDHFKSVNDTYGHQAGDQVIAAFGTLMSEGLNPKDIAGRVGGEEFAVASIDVESKGARLYAESLRKAFQALHFVFMPSRSEVTGSFGIAELAPGESLKAVIARADKALYQAKKNGRNCVCVAEGAPTNGQGHTVRSGDDRRSDVDG